MPRSAACVETPNFRSSQRACHFESFLDNNINHPSRIPFPVEPSLLQLRAAFCIPLIDFRNQRIIQITTARPERDEARHIAPGPRSAPLQSKIVAAATLEHLERSIESEPQSWRVIPKRRTRCSSAFALRRPPKLESSTSRALAAPSS
jgi:hypothetical protein